jgi:putative inorganic carbon (hco3(-)) transporter
MSFFLFLLYVFLTFFRPIELFAPDLAEYRVMLVLWVLAFSTAVLQALSRKEVAASKIHFGLLGAMASIMAISVAASGWLGGAVQALEDFIPAATLFMLVVMNVTSLEHLRKTCIVVVGALVLSSALGINAYHTGVYAEQLVLRQNTTLNDLQDSADAVNARPTAEETLIPAKDKSGWYMWRMRGMVFFNDPNDFAQALVMALPLLWGAWKQGQRWRNLLVVVLPGSALAYGILLTQSRGAVVGLAAMLFIGVRRMLGTVKTGLLLGTMLAAVVVTNMAGGRAFSSQERSAEERIEAWIVGLQLLKEHPLIGAGYGRFTDFNHLTAHNSYVLCFAEIGLVGYFIWLGLIVLSFKGLNAALKHLPQDAPERHYAGLLRSALVGFMACAWFLSRTYQPVLYFMLGLCAAMWWLARQAARAQAVPGAELPADLERPTWAGTTVLVLVVTILAVLGFVRSHTFA